MRTVSLLIPVALLITSTSSCLAAGKPAKDDPVRREFVEAIRHVPSYARSTGLQFDVRKMWVSERYGYVCTLFKNKKGEHQKTDSGYSVHQIVLEKADGKWKAVAEMEGISESSKQVQCGTDAKGKISEDFLDKIAQNPQMALKAAAPAAAPASAAKP